MTAFTRKEILRFAVLAALIFALLAWEGTGLEKAYACFLRGMIPLLPVGLDGTRQIEVPSDQPDSGVTQVVVVNRTLLAPDGSGPVRAVRLPDVTFWNGSALFLALALATPLTRVARLRLAASGFVALQLVFAVAITYALWNEGRHLGFQITPRAWERAADEMQGVIVERACLVGPVLVWLVGLLVATRRRGEMSRPTVGA